MGQKLDTMTHHRRRQQRQSKDELLYKCVSTHNVDAIKTLHLQGATLEWIDREGKTPLIVACMDSGLINVAKTLIDLGANINAYRPGRNGGTPLHHAAKRGLESTVNLLLSHGANALVRNDDCQTPLDVARIKGNTTVVRGIESHICYFSGWLREFYGPGFLEALAPQLLSRKIWVVVVPRGSGNPAKPPRFELAIYLTLQDAQPRTVIALWKAEVNEPKFHQQEPALTVFDSSTKIRYKLASAYEGDKQQVQLLYNACRGISQVMPSTVSAHQDATKAMDSTKEPTNKNAENYNGWGSSTSTDTHNGWGPSVEHSEASYNGWRDKPPKKDYNGWGAPDPGPSDKQSQVAQTHLNSSPVLQTSSGVSATVPSAPPIPEEVSGEGPIRYPSVEDSLDDWRVPDISNEASVTSDVKNEGTSSSCPICWEAPVEGACIPCGHMAGCMSCLNEIKAKKGVCPVCRNEMNQVIRLYAV